MKVLCIDKKEPDRFQNSFVWDAYKEIIVGEIYNVVNTNSSGDYELAEFFIPIMPIWWEKECFIPISDIDETEFKRENLLEKVLI